MYTKTIAVAVAIYADTNTVEVIDYGSVANCKVKVSRLVSQIQQKFTSGVHVVYEAGPCGFVLWRHLQQLGHDLAFSGKVKYWRVELLLFQSFNTAKHDLEK